MRTSNIAVSENLPSDFHKILKCFKMYGFINCSHFYDVCLWLMKVKGKIIPRFKIFNNCHLVLHLVIACVDIVSPEAGGEVYGDLQQVSGCHIRKSTKIWFSFFIHRFRSSFVSALSQFLVTHMVFMHWLTSVSQSSSR